MPELKEVLGTLSALSLILSLNGCAPSPSKLKNEDEISSALENKDETAAKIGDGRHCLVSLDSLQVSDGMKTFLTKDIDHLQQSLTLEERKTIANLVCPNHKGFLVDQDGRLYVFELVEGVRKKVDPFVQVVLQITGYANSAERYIKELNLPQFKI